MVLELANREYTTCDILPELCVANTTETNMDIENLMGVGMRGGEPSQGSPPGVLLLSVYTSMMHPL